jgi:hypothetical protein
VAMDDSGQAAVAQFARDMGINYTVLMGTDKMADAYGGVEALPTTFYISRDGKVVNRIFGLATEGEVEENIKSALAAGEPQHVASTEAH